MSDSLGEQRPGWRRRLHSIIYEANTPLGRLFDIALLVFIVASICIVALDSVQEYHQRYGAFFIELEWIFTIIFTIEFLLRLLVLRRPMRFVFSPLGLIDLLSILPAYLSLIYPGAQTLLVLRAFRLLRIFRIFKLTRFMDEARTLRYALRRSMRKIAIFMLTVSTITVILGSVMYLVEINNPAFSSIPTSIYWATVTLTTVGYGDISPITPLGKFISTIMMLIGYGIIAVPTGIFASEMLSKRHPGHSTDACPVCGREGHDSDAKFCKWCGAKL